MSPILDMMYRSRHVRVFSDEAEIPSFMIVIDGQCWPGYTSRVDALAAARQWVRR